MAVGIQNGESGASVREKLNNLFAQRYNSIGSPVDLVTQRGKIVGSGSDGVSGFIAGKWNYGGSGSFSSVVRGGRDIIQMTGPSSGATSMVIRRKVTLQALENIGVWVETPNVTAGAYTMVICYSSDVPADPPTTDPTNRRTLTIVQGDIQYGSRQCIRVNKSGKLYSQATPSGTAWVDTGSPDPAQIAYVDVRLVCDSSVPVDERVMWVDTVELDAKAVPLVMIGTDGDKTATSLALMAQRGIPFYNATDGEDLPSDYAYFDDFIARGNEIVCNGKNHTNYGANSSTLAADIDYCRDIYAARGWPLDNTFAYPLNSRSAATDAILIEKGFTLARSFRHPPISLSLVGIPAARPTPGLTETGIINLGSYSCDQQSGATMSAWIDDAISTGSGFNAYWHNLTSSASPSSVQTNVTEFTTFIDYAKAKHEAGDIRLCLPKEAARLLLW